MYPGKSESCYTCGRAPDARVNDTIQAHFCSSRCRDLWQVREAFDSRLAEIVILGQRGGKGAEGAISIIDDLRANWLDRDHDGWLDRSTRSHRAMILADHGQYEEALDDLRKVEARTPFGTDDYVLAKKSISRTLEMAGRPEQALDELGLVIAAWEHLPRWTVPGLLGTYADIASSAGINTEISCRDVLVTWADKVGMQMPVELAVANVRAAIADASAEWNRGIERFAALCKAIQDKPRETCEGIIGGYVASEPIGHFRERARRLLEEVAG